MKLSHTLTLNVDQLDVLIDALGGHKKVLSLKLMMDKLTEGDEDFEILNGVQIGSIEVTKRLLEDLKKTALYADYKEKNEHLGKTIQLPKKREDVRMQDVVDTLLPALEYVIEHADSIAQSEAQIRKIRLTVAVARAAIDRGES